MPKTRRFNDDLAVLAHFFTQPWLRPATALTESAQAAVLNWTSFNLQALGRLDEAVQPIQVSFEMVVKQEDWLNAAIDAGILSDLFVALGDLAEARHYGSFSVNYADQFGDLFYRMASRSSLADALLQSGELPCALALFQEAEQFQQEDQPECPTLYSVQGFCYCDLLLAQGEIAVVLVRVAYDLDCWENRFNNGSLLDLSLPKLSLARAHVHIAVQVRADNTQQKESGDTVIDHTQKAQKFLEQAGRSGLAGSGI